MVAGTSWGQAEVVRPLLVVVVVVVQLLAWGPTGAWWERQEQRPHPMQVQRLHHPAMQAQAAAAAALDFASRSCTR